MTNYREKRKMIKYNHVCNNLLTESIKAGTKIIPTEFGTFKIRKNGKYVIIIDRGTQWEETVKATLIKKL